jgi:hypothetical protein
MSHRSRLLATAVLTSAALLLTPLVPAGAATPTAPTPSTSTQSISPDEIPPNISGSNKVTFAAAPGNASGLDGRSSFSYNRMAAGTVIEDFLGVSNFSDQPETFTLGSADAFINGSGVLTLNADNQKSTDLGSWITFSHTQVTIPAHARLNEPVKITVPPNAKPGDHEGGAFVEFKIGSSSSSANSFVQDHRVGVPIYISVPGKVVTGFSISSLTSSYHKTLNPFGEGGASVSYTITNTGNVILSGTQNIAITGLFGIPLASVKGPAVPALLPGDSFKVKLSVPGVFPLGWMTAKVSIQPKVTHPDSAGPSPKVVTKVTKTAGLWGTPFLLILIILLVIIGVWGGRLWFRYRRDYRQVQLFDAVERARQEASAQLTGASAASGGTEKSTSET